MIRPNKPGLADHQKSGARIFLLRASGVVGAAAAQVVQLI